MAAAGRKRKSHGAGRVSLRKQGKYWHARCSYQGQRRFLALRVTNVERAEDMAREISDMIERGTEWERICTSITREKGVTTLQAVADEFLATDEWGQGTKTGTKSSLDRILREFGDKPVTSITAGQIRGYIQRRHEQDGLAKSSRNRELAIIKKLFKVAKTWGYIEYNPANTDEVKIESIGRKMPRPYRREEIQKLREALEPRHSRIMNVYLNTGMRRGEMMALMWRDVAWDRGIIVVRNTKNDEDREIPMNDTVVTILREVRREWESDGSAITDLRVFGPKADIRQVLVRAMKRSVFEPDRMESLRPLHSFRDTFLTGLGDMGYPLHEIQELAGHKSIEMTRRYVKPSQERIREAVSRLNF